MDATDFRLTDEEIAEALAQEDLFFVLDKQRRPVAATYGEYAAALPTVPKVAMTDLADGFVRVTTSFDGTDFCDPDDTPKPFATRSYVGDGDEVCREGAWATWQEALEGHEKVVQHYRNLHASARTGALTLPSSARRPSLVATETAAPARKRSRKDR